MVSEEGGEEGPVVGLTYTKNEVKIYGNLLDCNLLLKYN